MIDSRTSGLWLNTRILIDWSPILRASGSSRVDDAMLSAVPEITQGEGLEVRPHRGHRRRAVARGPPSGTVPARNAARRDAVRATRARVPERGLRVRRLHRV